MEVTCLNLVLIKIREKDIIREVALGKVATHLYLKITIKELKFSVEHGGVGTTLNVIKH